MKIGAVSLKAGFSLIEALIALSIAAISLTVIFELQLQLTAGQRRSEATLIRLGMRANALAAVRDINPMAQPDGQVTLPPNLLVHWTSTPITPVRLSTGFPTGDGSFQVCLYQVTVAITDNNGAQLGSIVVERLGWYRPGRDANVLG